MEENKKIPLWVLLAFSSIQARRSALILIWASIAFSLYCVPWTILFASPAWLAKIFLIDDWSWLAMMLPINLWYYLGLRWMDRNAGWTVPEIGDV